MKFIDPSIGKTVLLSRMVIFGKGAVWLSLKCMKAAIMVGLIKITEVIIIIVIIGCN